MLIKPVDFPKILLLGVNHLSFHGTFWYLTSLVCSEFNCYQNCDSYKHIELKLYLQFHLPSYRSATSIVRRTWHSND